MTLLRCCLLQAAALASRKRKQRELEERRNEQCIRDQLARVVMLPLQTCKRPRMTAKVSWPAPNRGSNGSAQPSWNGDRH